MVLYVKIISHILISYLYIFAFISQYRSDVT